MKTIKDFLIQGTEKYYKYLIEHDKGIENIKITDFSAIAPFTFIATTEKPIKDFSFVTHIVIDEKKIPISNFDCLQLPEENKFILKTTESNSKIFAGYKEMHLIVSFRELVLRIKKAYQNEKELKPPIKKPSITFDFTHFADTPFSEPQQKAIMNIFTSSISYIWGGAGSGKTRFVLSYSAINYMLKKKTIIICAPTNIALENAMAEVIKLAKEKNLDTKSILRYGRPSTSFYREFPECCENLTKSTDIQKLQSRKAHIVELAKNLKTLSIIQNTEENISHITSAKKRITDIRTTIEELTLKRNLKQKDYIDEERKLYYINTTVNRLNKKGLLSKIKNRTFSNKKRMVLLEKSLVELSEQNKLVENIANEINVLDTNITSAENEIILLLNNIKQREDAVHKNISKDLQGISLSTDLNTILAQIENYKSKILIRNAGIIKQHNDLANKSAEKLKAIYEKTISDIEEISIESDKKEKQKIHILGCTLDSFATIFNDTNPEHIFLDEACYSCIAKSALLFFKDCPITYLGDHMQLPPVAEIDEKDIESDYKEAFIWAESGIYALNIFENEFEKMRNNYIDNNSEISSLINITPLNETFRFGPRLASVLNDYVYKTGFHSVRRDETEIKILHAPKITETKNKRENIDEVNAIKKYLQSAAIQDYAIIAPYTNQVKLLKNSLHYLDSDRIMTVHKSQGQEWDCVILSVSDTNDKFFTNSKNKISRGKELINTAISRTKKELIIACDANYWITQEKQIISELVKIGKYISLTKEKVSEQEPKYEESRYLPPILKRQTK